jgi:hypothetical protein
MSYGGQISQLEKTYSCINLKSNPSTSSSQPVAHFKTLDDYVKFMEGRLNQRVPQILDIGLAKYYVCFWPKANISPEYYDTHIGEFKQTKETLYKALSSAVTAGLTNVDKSVQLKEAIKKTESKGSSPGVTPTPPPVPPKPGFTCPPAVITSFSPAVGNIGTIIQINGLNFETTKEIKIGTTIVPVKDITILNSKTIRITVPKVGTGVRSVDKISITTDYGTVTSTNDFTYDPTMVVVAEPAQPTTVQGAAASVPPSVAPNVPNSNTQPQQTGPVVLVEKQTYNLVGSVSKEEINVNPDAGPWKIVQNQVDWSYRAVAPKTGPNNTITEEVISKRTDSRQLEDYVSTDKKSFSVTDFDIVSIVQEEIDDPIEEKKVTKIYNQITFFTTHDDKYVKFRQTNNPNDVIQDVFQVFKFTILLK